MKGRGPYPSIVLWTSFAAIVIASALLLLRACSLIFPLASVLPARGWNFCPATPLALSAEAARGASLRQAAADLELELGRKQLACAGIPKPPPPPLQLPKRAGAPRPQQTALLKPPPPPPPPPPRPVDLDAERWNNRDLRVLDGCWQLGRESRTSYSGPRGSEICVVHTGRICFGVNGTGTREMATTCPSLGYGTCRAPVTAAFAGDGTLTTTQPMVPCTDGSNWNAVLNNLTCRRVNDSLAICRDNAGFEHEFRR